MLNQTNIASNNNKYYILQLLEKRSTTAAGPDLAVWFRWGRVGLELEKITILLNFLNKWVNFLLWQNFQDFFSILKILFSNTFRDFLEGFFRI